MSSTSACFLKYFALPFARQSVKKKLKIVGKFDDLETHECVYSQSVPTFCSLLVLRKTERYFSCPCGSYSLW